MPVGVTYLEQAYAVFAQSDLSLGSYRTVWGFATFDAMQNMGAKCAIPGSDFERLLNELTSFRGVAFATAKLEQMYQPASPARRI